MPQAAIFGKLGENRAGSQQTGQESSRSYMERRAKSSKGFIGINGFQNALFKRWVKAVRQVRLTAALLRKQERGIGG